MPIGPFSGSASQRRRDRGAAVVAGHPRWHGIHHPELIALPPRRFSRLDMLPAVERARATARDRRIEATVETVAGHPRWRGIRHPERIFFSRLDEDELAVLSYRAALRLAILHAHESDDLCRRISAVADSIGRRSWTWAAAPSELSDTPARMPRRRNLRTLGPLPTRTSRRRVRPAGRLLAH